LCRHGRVYRVAGIFLHMQLRDKREELEALEAEIQRQELQNESLQEKADNSEMYLEDEARDQGYSLPGEQIYEVVPEN